jgi:hypothetical protein
MTFRCCWLIEPSSDEHEPQRIRRLKHGDEAIRVMVIGCLAADPSAQTQPNSLGLGSIVFLDRTPW